MGRRRRKTEIGGGAGGVLFRGGSSHEISRAGRECFYGDRGYDTDGKSNSNRRVRFGPSLSYLYETQEEILDVQVGLAEELRKPLIIHCVKAYSELIAVKKRTGSSVPWIIHGYNNNEQILQAVVGSRVLYFRGSGFAEFALECFSIVAGYPVGGVVFGE